MTDYAYRSEQMIGKDGGKHWIVYRREVIADGPQEVMLGPVERCQIPQGKPSTPDWQKTGGIFGSGCRLSRERYKACQYTQTPPKEIK